MSLPDVNEEFSGQRSVSHPGVHGKTTRVAVVCCLIYFPSLSLLPLSSLSSSNLKWKK